MIEVFKELNAINKDMNPVISLNTSVVRKHSQQILKQLCNKDIN